MTTNRKLGYIGAALAVLGVLLPVMLYHIPGRGTGEIQTIEIKDNMTNQEIGAMLYDHGLITSPRIFHLASAATGLSNKLQKGVYELTGTMSMQELLEALQKGKEKEIKLVVPEGYSVARISEALEKQGIMSRDTFKNAARHYVAPYDYMTPPDTAPLGYQVEGFLFPATYELQEKQDPKKLIKEMLATFDKKLTPQMREKIAAQGMTIYQFVTLASLVEREAQVDEDRYLIAAVFKKRLAMHMPLQSCASIQYILGYPKAELSIEDTQIPSPYNTYLHEGLPPGPIANPGEAAMKAVLDSPKTDYLFFVADKHGKHHFSRTYEEHLEKIKEVEQS